MIGFDGFDGSLPPRMRSIRTVYIQVVKQTIKSDKTFRMKTRQGHAALRHSLPEFGLAEIRYLNQDRGQYGRECQHGE